jgi:glutamine amidotransferase
MIATIFDYGAGNLHSLEKAIADDGTAVRITSDPMAALDTDVLVLPGVGSFAYAVERVGDARDSMREAINAGLPTVGICLGMQLLFDRSDEGPGAGLGVFEGAVTRLRGERVPHIGWNTVDDVRDPALNEVGLRDVYYANSFACRPADASTVAAWTTHEDDRFPAMVRRDRVAGIQFHPEKSSEPGVRALRAIIREVAR